MISSPRHLLAVGLCALVAAACSQSWPYGSWSGVDSNGHVATTATVRCPSAPAIPESFTVTLPGCDETGTYVVQVGSAITCTGAVSLHDGVAALAPGGCADGGSVSGRLVDSADPFLTAVESFVTGHAMVNGVSCAIDGEGALFPPADGGLPACPEPAPDGGNPDGGS